MRAPNIPLRYRTGKPEELANDLGRLASEIVAWSRSLPSERDSLPEVASVIVTGGTLSYGRMTRVAPQDPDWFVLSLPVPNPRDAGRAIQVARLTALGGVEVVTSAPGCTVNGLERLMLLGGIGITTITTDGVNFFMDNGGALNWGAGLV